MTLVRITRTDSWEKLDEKALPPKEEFYNNLRDSKKRMSQTKIINMPKICGNIVDFKHLGNIAIGT